MSSGSKSFAVVVLLVAGAAWAAGQAPPAAVPATGTPKLETSELKWDFGTVWQGTPLEYEVLIKNVGDAPLEILDIKSSCGCTIPTKPKSALAPGESDTLKITYTSDKKLGKAHQTVTLVTNDPQRQTAVVSVRGEVTPSFEMEPRGGLVFGGLLGSARESRTVEIVNKYEQPMKLELEASPEPGPYEITVREIEPGQKFAVTATTRPPLGVGAVQANVVLRTGHERPEKIEVLAYGFVRPPVNVTPKSLMLPKNSIMDMHYKLRVTCAPDAAIKVTSARASHESIKVALDDPAEQPAGQYTILVTLPPGDRIPDGAEPEIEILTDADDPALKALKVPIKIIHPRSGA